MIAKVIVGKSFGGCVGYLLEKEKATVIDSLGVRDYDVKSIIADLNAQRKLHPSLGNAVGHTVLSWSNEDRDKLTVEKMAEHAREYMAKIGIKDTQCLTVLHSDKLHPHLHIVYNRVDNNGKTIDNYNHWQKSHRICREMTQRYGYHFGKGKGQVNRQALRGSDKLRYEIYDALKPALQKSTSWKQLENRLAKSGVNILYKYRSGTSEVQGVSFEKDGVKFKGSDIDRQFSHGKIDGQLRENRQQMAESPLLDSRSLADQIKEVLDSSHRDTEQWQENRSDSHGTGLLGILLDGEPISIEPDPVGDAEKRRRKRKKHEAEQSRGIGR